MVNRYDILDRAGIVSNQFICLDEDVWLDSHATCHRTHRDVKDMLIEYKLNGWHVVRFGLKEDPVVEEAKKIFTIEEAVFIPDRCDMIECVRIWGGREMISFCFVQSGTPDMWQSGMHGNHKGYIVHPVGSLKKILLQRIKFKEEVRFYDEDGTRL